MSDMPQSADGDEHVAPRAHLATAEASQPELPDNSLPADDSSTAPKPKPRTICGVCNKEASKYKCPKCPLAYCSVACSRTHRDNHPPSEPRPPVLEPEVKEKPKDNHPFSVLDGSMELQQLFRKYPNLPSRLKQIYDTTLPPKDESFVKGGLPTKVPPVYASKKNNEPWTQDIGLRRGRQALRQARTDPGEDGDGVREYCELVLYLLSKSEKENDVTELVRQEAAMEDAKLIEKLMQSEGR